MHCLSPKMVCETKIVAEDHDSISGAKKESLLVSSSAQMWPSSRAGSGSPAAGPQLQPQPPPPSPAPDGEDQKKGVCIREFHPSEQEAVRRIFYEGIMERIPNTAFRGLKDQPWTQMVYGTMAGIVYFSSLSP
uniref:N-acetylaspartate synthetase isoform X2 n=1 Tax=Podarcis muralis TaxID=64176 RepID=UPI00109F13AA|nr:N-acetylaspartate synthetase isoform X2 [Podarcis muralis]